MSILAAIYALGVVTSLSGSRTNQNGIRTHFNALCQAVEDDPQRYRQDTERLGALVELITKGY